MSGSTKMYRKSANFQGMNTNRGTEKYSSGGNVGYEGTLMSGENDKKRGSNGRNKSKSSSGPKL